MSGDALAAERTALHGRPSARELALLIAIVALAAILRLPNLDQRGAWDADQGTDMLVLQGLVDRGEVPLLGPKTSIGTFHHGAVYYYLLAPAAFLSGADPVAVTGEIALFGLGAVVATWWLARLIAGPVAGPRRRPADGRLPRRHRGVDVHLEPQPRSRSHRRSRSRRRCTRCARGTPAGGSCPAVGAMVVMQCHVLGVVVVPPLVVAWLADVRGRRRRGERLGPAAGAGAGAVAIIAAGYLPLLAFELGHDFAETRAILGYLGGGGSGAASGVLGRIGIVGLRSLSWPVPGCSPSDRCWRCWRCWPRAGWPPWPSLGARGGARRAAAWLVGSVGWAIVALALFAPEPGGGHPRAAQRPLPLVPRPARAGARRVRARAHGRGERGTDTVEPGTTGPRRRCGDPAGRRVRRGLATVRVARRWLAAGRPGRGPDDPVRRVRSARARRHPAVQERQRAPVPARAPWGRHPCRTPGRAPRTPRSWSCATRCSPTSSVPPAGALQRTRSSRRARRT